MRQGGAGQLLTAGVAGQYAQAQSVRSAFLHGHGGSGRTYCMTEVVMTVVRHFLGGQGAKAIAAHNNAARQLLRKTMHAAGKMARGQSLKAKHLKPNARSRKALEKKWCAGFLSSSLPFLSLCAFSKDLLVRASRSNAKQVSKVVVLLQRGFTMRS